MPQILPFPFRQRLLFFSLVWTTSIYIFFLFKHSKLILEDEPVGREFLHKKGISQTTIRQTYEILDAKLKIDRTQNLNRDTILKKLSKNSNVPIAYWLETDSNKFSSNKCLHPPNIFDLKFNNVYWQTLNLFDSTFYLLNAYYDMRVRLGPTPFVRIIAMIDKINPPRVLCQFWYGNVIKTKIAEKVLFSRAENIYMWHKNWGNYKDGTLQPFLISCPVPKLGNINYIPDAVSLVKRVCEKPSNILKIIYKRPAKKETFAVCVKGLDFPFEDISVKLVEWIELLHILGAKKIYMYEFETHPNVSKVLSYYAAKNMIELAPITLPGNQPNLQGLRHFYLKLKLTNKRQNELIPYNDCLYKNLYSYDYIVLLDTDEIIMPLADRNWKDMIYNVVTLAMTEAPYTRASYNFRNVYFFDDLKNEFSNTPYGIPEYLHMLQHIYRSKKYTKLGNYVKSFHSTDRVISLHNHFPINCFGPCTSYSVPESVGHLQHYRKDCVDPLKSKCNEFRMDIVRDTSIWRFKNQLIPRAGETLFSLGFFKDSKKHERNSFP